MLIIVAVALCHLNSGERKLGLKNSGTAPSSRRSGFESRSGLNVCYVMLKWHNITAKIINIQIVSIRSSNEIPSIDLIYANYSDRVVYSRVSHSGYHGLVYVHRILSPIFPSKGAFHNHLKTN